MMSSPLAMTNDLRKLTPADRRILLNPEIIAINQDTLGLAAQRKVFNNDYQIYVRKLTGGRHAIALLNTADQPLTLTADFAALGIEGKHQVRDVWQHKQIASNAKRWKGHVKPHETIVLVIE